MMRLAVLGLGDRGRRRFLALSSVPGVSVDKVYDRDENARRWVKEWCPEIEVTTNPVRVLSDPAIEAVVLALPPAEQAEVACQALASGKHCLVEWPPAMSLEGLAELQRFSRRRERMALVSVPLLFHPAVTRAKNLLAQGRLGRVFYLSALHHQPGLFRMDHHVTWSLAYEEIFLSLVLLGETPRRVRATGCYFLNHRADTVSLHLEFLSGRHALVNVSCLEAEPVRSFSLVGSKRSLRLNLLAMQSAPALHPPAREQEEEPGDNGETGQEPGRPGGRALTPLQAETIHFLKCLSGSQTPLADLVRLDDLLRVLLAADLSLRYDGAQVEVSRLSVQIPMGWRAAA